MSGIVRIGGAAGSGNYLQRAWAAYTTYSSGSTDIDTDNTIPQNTEGAETVTCSITPLSATSRIRVRVFANILIAANGSGNLALFKDSGADALISVPCDTQNGHQSGLSLEWEEASGSTAARTYKARVGVASVTGTGTCYFNGNASNRLHGGVQAHTMVVEEIVA